MPSNEKLHVVALQDNYFTSFQSFFFQVVKDYNGIQGLISVFLLVKVDK